MTTTFRIDIGQTFRPIIFSLKDADGNPFSLIDYDARLQIRTQATLKGVLILERSTENDTLIMDAVNGTIQFGLTWEETAVLREGVFLWELELMTPDNERFIIAQGTAIIAAGVVR